MFKPYDNTASDDYNWTAPNVVDFTHPTGKEMYQIEIGIIKIEGKCG